MHCMQTTAGCGGCKPTVVPSTCSAALRMPPITSLFELSGLGRSPGGTTGKQPDISWGGCAYFQALFTVFRFAQCRRMLTLAHANTQAPARRHAPDERYVRDICEAGRDGVAEKQEHPEGCTSCWRWSFWRWQSLAERTTCSSSRKSMSAHEMLMTRRSSRHRNKRSLSLRAGRPCRAYSFISDRVSNLRKANRNTAESCHASLKTAAIIP